MINIQIHTTWDILWYVKSIGLSVQKDDKTNFATSQRWVFAKDLCRSAWLRWIYSSLRNQLSNWKGQYLETSIRCQLLKPLKSQRVESSRWTGLWTILVYVLVCQYEIQKYYKYPIILHFILIHGANLMMHCIILIFIQFRNELTKPSYLFLGQTS